MREGCSFPGRTVTSNKANSQAAGSTHGEEGTGELMCRCKALCWLLMEQAYSGRQHTQREPRRAVAQVLRV